MTYWLGALDIFLLSLSLWTLSKREILARILAKPSCYQNEEKSGSLLHIEGSEPKGHKSTNFHFKFLKLTYIFFHYVNFAEKWTYDLLAGSPRFGGDIAGVGIK